MNGQTNESYAGKNNNKTGIMYLQIQIFEREGNLNTQQNIAPNITNDFIFI